MLDTKILIVDDVEEILDLYEVILNAEFDVDVIRASSSKEAIEILKEDDSIKLIISDMNMPEGNGDLLLNFNVENENLPFILSTSDSFTNLPELTQLQLNDGKNFYYLEKPARGNQLVDLTNRCFDPSLPNSNIEIQSTSYKKIQIDFLKPFLNENSNIYIKIGENKFVKIVHENDLNEVAQLEKYQLKGERFAYITEDNYAPLIDKLFSKLSTSLDSVKQFDDLMDVGSLGYEVLNTSLKQLGVSEEQKEYVNKFVNKCSRQLRQNEEINSLLKTLYKNKGYQCGHSLLAIHICNMIILNTPFSNTQQLEKLGYAALLHDITFDKGSLSQFIDKNEEFDKLDDTDSAMVLNHLHSAGELVNKFNFISDDVKKIILEHHEKCDGTGFPRGLRGAVISPLSAIFIISLRAAHFMFFNDYPTQKEELISMFNEEYNLGNFKKPLKSFIKSIS